MTADQNGRYAFVKCIGRGGMAEVWTGKSFGSGGFEKVVAIKILSPDIVDNEGYQRALTDEALLTVQLKHPNIVDIYDLNLEAENPFMVMEYVEGTELRDLLKTLRKKNERLSVPIAAYIISELSKALSHAHTRRDPDSGRPFRIVHRDVSPSNILVSKEGDIKLTDFGIAKSTLQSSKTQTGEIKGKFRYMSPEQARADTVDYRSDIYSLGLVFYECLFGRPAYEADGDLALLKKAQKGDIDFPDEIDPPLQRILDRLLAPDPNERYSELDSFRTELGQYMLNHGGIVEREYFSRYLSDLALPKIRQAIAERKHAEEWLPAPESNIIDPTGRISTVEESVGKPKKKYYLYGGIAAATVLLMIGYGMMHNPVESLTTAETAITAEEAVAVQEAPPSAGTLRITTEPTESSIKVKVGKARFSKPSPAVFSDLPFDKEIEITASKNGYQRLSKKITLSAEQPEETVNLPLQKISKVKVRMVATPYAEVSIPGHFERIETPVSDRVLPAGKYSVIFLHPPTQRRATAQLSAHGGGSYVCTANMAVTDQSKPPSASCRRL